MLSSPGRLRQNTSTRLWWRVLLPVVMSLVSVFLMVLAKRQQPMLWKKGTGWEVPARVINSLINGPGFIPLGNVIRIPIPYSLNKALNYDGDKLLGIFAFWFLFGLSIDRRRSQRSIDQQCPIFAAVLFASAAAALGFFGVAEDVVLFRDPSLEWLILTNFPLRTWDAMKFGLLVWCVSFSTYFAGRAFVAVRKSLTKPQATLGCLS